MSNAKVFDPVPAQKRARAAEGPAASPLLAVRPFAEAKAKVENGEQGDLYGQYVQRRAVAAATEGGGALGSGENRVASILSGPSLVAQRYVPQTDPGSAFRQLAALSDTEDPSPVQLRALEGAAGNRAVNHLLAQRSIQAKAFSDHALQTKGDRSGIRTSPLLRSAPTTPDRRTSGNLGKKCV